MTLPSTQILLSLPVEHICMCHHLELSYYSTLSFNGASNVIQNGAYKCAAKVVNGYGITYGPIESALINLTVQSKYKSK